MDPVHQVLEYLEQFPPEAGAIELKDQLSAFTHRDLRAACSRLNLSVSKRQNKKAGFISVLVSNWMTAKSVASTPQVTKTAFESSNSQLKSDMDLTYDVAQFVQLFPPHDHVEQLQNQLNACRARTLRSACVLLGLHPNKSFTKKDFLGLLVSYWQDSSAVTPAASRVEEPRQEDVEVVHTKRPRSEEQDVKKTPKKKNKALERRGDLFEEKTWDMAASLEKAKVVKEWASAIEILSRVDGSAESIESIRKLIDGVVHSAASEF